MKKIIIAFCFLFFFPVFSNYPELYVEVQNSGIFFQIKIRPFENDQSSNKINIISVEVLKPDQFDDGSIEIEVIDDQFKSFNPKSGTIKFKRGYNLPVGTYNLFINEVDYGFLYIFEDEVYFDPINCL